MTSRSDIAFLDSELRYLEDAERKSYAAKRKKLENLLVDVLTAGVESGEFTVPDITGTGRALLGMCQSVVLWYRLDGPQTPPRSQCSLPRDSPESRRRHFLSTELPGMSD